MHLATFLFAAFATSATAQDDPFTVVLSSPVGAYTKNSFAVHAAFSVPTTNFDATDIQCESCLVGVVTGAGAAYDFTVTPTAQGSVSVEIPGASVTDAGLNGNQPSNTITTVYDTIQPVPTVTSPVGNHTNTPFTMTIAVDEAIKPPDASAVSCTNCTIGDISGADQSFDITINPTAEGTVSAFLLPGVLNDFAGNSNLATGNTISTTYDVTAPGLTLLASVPGATNSNQFDVSIVPSEPMPTLGSLASIDCTNGTFVWLVASYPSNYAIRVYPSSEGAVAISIPAGVSVDRAGNPNTASNAIGTTYDVTKPGVTLSTGVGLRTNAPFAVTATLSELPGPGLGGFTPADLECTNCTVGAFGGTPPVYTFTVTPIAEGFAYVKVPANVFADAAGNQNTMAPLAYGTTYDITPPGVTLSSPVSARTNAAFAVTATLGEPAVGFGAGDIACTNCTIGSFASPTTLTRTFTVTPTVEGSVSVSVAAGVFTDQATNANTAAPAAIATIYDATKPGVTLSSSAPAKVNSPIAAKATLSELPASSGSAQFTASDIHPTNCTIDNFSAAHPDYTFTVTPIAEGAFAFYVPINTFTDLAGNTNTQGSAINRTYDTTPPSATLSSAVGTYTNGAFGVTATVSEPVTGLEPADVSCTNCTIGAFSGTPPQYTFTVTPAAEGPVSVALPAGTFADLATNAGAASNTIATIYDTEALSVSLSSSVGARTNAPFAVTATTSETAVGFGPSDIACTNCTVGPFGGTPPQYTFTVTPLAENGVSVAVPASVFTDGALNPNTASNTIATIYDATSPTLALSSSVGTFTNSPFSVTATASEPLVGFAPADVTCTNCTVGSFIGTPPAYTFTVTPAAEGNVAIGISAAVATDEAGNANTESAVAISAVYDTTAPVAQLQTIALRKVAGSVVGTFSASDNASGVANVHLLARKDGDSGWTDLGTVSAPGFQFEPVGGTGIHHVALVATDFAGNSEAAPAPDSAGEGTTLYNAVPNGPFVHPVVAPGTYDFPMTDAINVTIAVAEVATSGTLAVSRLVGNVAPSGVSAENLLDARLTIATAAGLDATGYTVTMPYEEELLGDVAENQIDTAFRDTGSQVTPQPIPPIDAIQNIVTFTPAGFSDWYFGNNAADVADWQVLED